MGWMFCTFLGLQCVGFAFVGFLVAIFFFFETASALSTPKQCSVNQLPAYFRALNGIQAAVFCLRRPKNTCRFQ